MNAKAKIFTAVCDSLQNYNRTYQDLGRKIWDKNTSYAIAEVSYKSIMTSPEMIETYLSDLGVSYRRIMSARDRYNEATMRMLNEAKNAA